MPMPLRLPGGGFTFSRSSQSMDLQNQFRTQTGMNPMDTPRNSLAPEGRGGRTGSSPRFTDAFRLFAMGFGGGGQQQAAPAAAQAFQPGDDPNTAAGAQARQDSAADQLGFTDPIVGGRREALMSRRSKGAGLAGLSRGFAASHLLK